MFGASTTPAIRRLPSTHPVDPLQTVAQPKTGQSRLATTGYCSLHQAGENGAEQPAAARNEVDPRARSPNTQTRVIGTPIRYPGA